MADVILSAELQARVDQFVSNLLAASNTASSTGAAVTQMSTNISRNIANVNSLNLTAFNTALNSGTLSIQRLGAAVPAIVRPLTTGVNQASNALTNLGRVAQDAPFGFIGIQNNLNPLLESFQRLRTETGSNVAALRALGQSFLGPAGLGVALSLVTSAITFYTLYQQKANKATNDAKKSTDDYISTLDQLTQVQVKGAQNAQKEVTDLRILYSVYQNANLPLKDRKEAYEELQKQYPDYFKNIKFEKEASSATKKAYDELTQAIIATGRARAAADLITKNSSRQLENEQKIADLEKQKLKDQLAFDKASKRGTVSGGAGILGSAGSSTLAIAENKKIQETQSQINNIKTDTNILTQRNLDLVKAVNEEVAKGANVPGQGFGDTDKKNKEYVAKYGKALLDVKTLSDSFYVSLSSGLKTNPIISYVDTTDKSLTKLRNVYGFTEEALMSFANSSNGSFADLLSNTEKFTTGFEELISGQFKSSLSDFGTSIGEAISTGGNVLEAAGLSLLEGFSKFLSGYGDLLIEYGAAAVLKSKLDLAALIPGAGIAAGIAAIAAGVALKIAAGAIGGFASGKGNKSKGNGVTAFASGGIISGPTLGLMGEYAGAKSDPEVVAPLSKLKKMLGEMDDSGNVITKNNSNIVVLNSEYVIRGSDIVVVTKRAEAERNRQG